jgi:microcin C transport system permease protein
MTWPRRRAFSFPAVEMLAYIVRRILLMVPTIFGILLISFIIVQFAPGGPVERILAQLQGLETNATANFTGGADMRAGGGGAAEYGSRYRGAQGLDPKFIAELNKQFGFDKPAPERFWIMVKNYFCFDFGKSYFRDTSVLELIKEKLPLGIAKAVRDGSRFDVWTSSVIIVGYAIPSFLFAIFLIVLFCGGSFWQIFPLRGLTSENFMSLSLLGKIKDYLWHITLPVTALTLSAFATITFLTKNSFLDEIRKQYVLTARMKGLSERRVLYGHVFRNAMMIVVAGFPGAFINAFFGGALLIETIFSLDGLGLLSYESVINRDYPVVFANVYIFALLGLVVNLISDLTYTWIDPRIDFETREV